MQAKRHYRKLLDWRKLEASKSYAPYPVSAQDRRFISRAGLVRSRENSSAAATAGILRRKPPSRDWGTSRERMARIHKRDQASTRQSLC